MDKMFYTMQEVCQKLGKSEDEVREMVSSGQLQEFRDKDELVFKVEQINLLVGSDEDTGDVELDLGDASGISGTGLDLTGNSGFDLAGADPNAGDASAASAAASGTDLGLTGGGGLGLTGGGSGMDLGDSGSAAGLSAFDTGVDMASDDDAGATRVSDSIEDDDLTLESVGSGSGLLDLTRESDDTSLGAELLEEIYSSDDDQFDIPASASGLFEAAGPDETAVSGAVSDPGMPAQAAPMPGVPMAAAQESYDGSGSGLAGGAAVGGTIALIVLLIIVIVELGGSTSTLAMSIAGDLWIWTGGIAVVAILAILGGMFIGKASE
jgi:hypothetical protein